MDYQDALNALTNAAALEQVWRERLNPELQLQAMHAFLQRSGLADVSGVDDSDSESWSDCSLGLESENLLASSDSSDGKKLENPRQTRKSQKKVQETKVNTISDEMTVSSEQEDGDDQEDDDDTDEEVDEKEPLTVKHCEKGAKRKWDKRQYCVYCEKPQSKIARHLERKHKHEKDVAVLTSLPKNSKKRRVMLDQLRLKGNYLHNIQVLEKGQGQIVTCRQPSGEASAHDYLPCNICYGFFLKDDLWKHEDFCRKRMGKPAEKSKKRKRVQAAASCLIPFKGAASGRCRKILNRMMIDDVSIEVKSDPLICEFGDRLLEKHEGDTSKDGYVSQKMRELGRFVLAAKSLDHKVKRLQDILVPSKFQLTVQAAKKASGYANSKYKYDTPSLALKLGHSLKVVCDIVIGQHIKAEEEAAANRVRSYLRSIGSQWDHYVSRQTRTNSEDSKWNKTDMIPLTKDVMKLLKFLKSMEEEAKERLSAGPDPKEYRKLSESVLSQIVLFNRRRQGEAARMLLMTYRNRNTAVLPRDTVTFLSKLEQHLSHGFTTVVVRGKRGCHVPVLLTREMEASLAVLVEQRSEENDILDSNQYVFARQNSDSHLRGSDCLRKFAAACEAEFPETLTSTHLRKHVATLCQIMNLKEHELDQVAKFMGHDIGVQREYYRLPENALQVAKISMILLAVELGPDVYKGKSLDEIDLSLKVGAEKPQNKLMDAEGNDCYRFTQDGWKEDFFSPKSFELPQDLDGPGTQMQKTVARPSEKDSEKTLTSGSSEQQMLKTSGPQESLKLPQDLDGAALVCAASRKAKRRPWSDLEKAAVYRQFGSFITLQKVPGKDLCLACLEAEPALHTRHWKDIKNQVHNLIQSNRNKLNS